MTSAPKDTLKTDLIAKACEALLALRRGLFIKVAHQARLAAGWTRAWLSQMTASEVIQGASRVEVMAAGELKSLTALCEWLDADDALITWARRIPRCLSVRRASV